MVLFLCSLRMAPAAMRCSPRAFVSAPMSTRTGPQRLWGSISSQPFSAPKPQPTAPPTSPAEGVGDLPEFRKLGLVEEVLAAVRELGLAEPSKIQNLAIPQILKGDDVSFASATGSGKTLAYLLPIVQQLKWQEEAGVLRQPMRPRALILVPTRELVTQVGPAYRTWPNQVFYDQPLTCVFVVRCWR
jgi:ATP-dependent helicase YprA (DUF1998 family)